MVRMMRLDYVDPHVHVGGLTMADNARKIKTLELSNYYSEEIRDIVLSQTEPLVFPKASARWPCSKWTPEFLADQLGNVQTTFRICAKVDSSFYKFPLDKVVTETDCEYAEASLQNFCAWLRDDLQGSGDLAKFPRAHYWCYADYKYMADIFSDLPSLRQGPLWKAFGFSEVTGDQSTLWIGSEGSYTPCHLDTYGCNLVAQVYGQKKWTLFPPSETDRLSPTRIPYEESSIFSNVNIKYPNLSLSPEFHKAIKYEVVLNPGDVLLVPRHWWHFVESLEPSISTNTWITLESDHADRICEAVTRTLVCSLKECEQEDQKLWLNPTEEIGRHTQNMDYIRQAVARGLQSDASEFQDTTLTNNDIIDCITTPEIVTQIANRLLAKTKNILLSGNRMEGSMAEKYQLLVQGASLSSSSDFNSNQSPFKVPAKPSSCRCECCGPSCRSGMVPKRPIRSLSEPGELGKHKYGEVYTCTNEGPSNKRKRP